MENNTIVVGDIKTPLTSMNRLSRQIINKETVVLNDTLDQLDVNRYLQDIPSKRRIIYIFLKCIWNVL